MIKLKDEIYDYNKIYLLIMNTQKHFQYFKYFETEFEKDQYKDRIKHIPFLMVIEDSSDMYWGYN